MATKYLIECTSERFGIELIFAAGALDASDPEDTVQDAACRAVLGKRPGARVVVKLDQRGKPITK